LAIFSLLLATLASANTPWPYPEKDVVFAFSASIPTELGGLLPSSKLPPVLHAPQPNGQPECAPVSRTQQGPKGQTMEAEVRTTFAPKWSSKEIHTYIVRASSQELMVHVLMPEHASCNVLVRDVYRRALKGESWLAWLLEGAPGVARKP
jgi:hypothetical protein